MPELSNVVSCFAAEVRTDKGRRLRGFFGKAPEVGAHFTGLLTPVRLLSVPDGETMSAGEIVLDLDGVRYLAADWATTSIFGNKVCKNFVLFQVHDYVRWTRIEGELEPISQTIRSTKEVELGSIGVLREMLDTSRDGTGVSVSKYRYLMGQKPRLNDQLENNRILRIDFVNGLYYVEAV